MISMSHDITLSILRPYLSVYNGASILCAMMSQTIAFTDKMTRFIKSTQISDKL